MLQNSRNGKKARPTNGDSWQANPGEIQSLLDDLIEKWQE
jgi:hypothetical protein